MLLIATGIRLPAPERKLMYTTDAPRTELRWSATWSDIVGADGPVITDFLGRSVPCLTDTDRDRLREAWRDQYPVASAVTPKDHDIWLTADRNSLRGALACALQSLDRALRTHIYGPAGSDNWHVWMGIDRALRGVVHALVLRRADPTVNVLAGPWEEVMGPLPGIDDMTVADPGYQPCPDCGRPRGARYVTEAEAARYARALLSMTESSVQAQRAQNEETRQRMRDWRNHYLSISEVRSVIQQIRPVKIRESVTKELEKQFLIPFS